MCTYFRAVVDIKYIPGILLVNNKNLQRLVGSYRCNVISVSGNDFNLKAGMKSQVRFQAHSLT